MGWITWDKTLELGHAEMDADHRRLVDFFNKLAHSVVNPSDAEAHDRMLDELFVRARAHFDMEERLMATHAYPNSEAHSSEHARLIKSALEIRERFGASAQPSVSLLYFLDQWLTRHILSWDKELADFLNSVAAS